MRATIESTKLRVVYDASTRAINGSASFNDCLLTGPPLQNKLWNVLVRGIFNPVTINGDLQMAFLKNLPSALQKTLLKDEASMIFKMPASTFVCGNLTFPSSNRLKFQSKKKNQPRRIRKYPWTLVEQKRRFIKYHRPS